MTCPICQDVGVVVTRADKPRVEACLECGKGGLMVGERVAVPKPGIYRGVAFDDYAAWDAVNSHILTGLARTPAHLHYELLNGGPEPTPSLDLGWLLHLAMLEPERYADEFVIPPKVDRRTKAGKATWVEFEAGAAGKRLIDAGTVAKVEAMRAALLAHPSAGEWLRSKGANEISVVWIDPETGVVCKARIDRIGMLGEWPIVGDVKTARNAGRRAFERVIFDYGYHLQAQHYLAGLHAIAPIAEGQPFRRFCFFVVENDPPHCVAVYELDESALVEAEQARQLRLRTWRQCVETGRWPGYGAGVDLVSLPPWAFRIQGDAA